jgi:Uma2 family endonuclease
MEWAQVVDNPLFRNLPFKIELNRFGQVLMSPASNKHGRIEYRVGRAIERGHKGGEIIIECSIQTSDGVKVSDVAWASDEFIAKYGYDTPYPRAPEICVEVVSPSNSDEEIKHKADLYLARGAVEVWIVDEDMHVRYFSAIGETKHSEMVKKVRI